MKYESKLANNNNIKEDCKSFFSYIKSKKGARVDVGLLENNAREVIMGNKEMAEELNNFFATVFTVKDTSNVPEIQEGQGVEVSGVDVTREKVLGKLNGLKVDVTWAGWTEP